MKLSDLYDADYRATHPQAETLASDMTATRPEEIRAAGIRRAFATIARSFLANEIRADRWVR